MNQMTEKYKDSNAAITKADKGYKLPKETQLC